MIVATAGHVDHGKTSLVKHLTGTDTDRLEEEKKRGLTINLGFAYHHVGDQIIGFVDVPGHIDFINNMLAGVGCVDFAILVVAADDGVMPQTREHLSILSLLGLQHGAVALTKVDLVADERVAEVRKNIIELLQSTQLADSPIFSVSNTSGDGVDQLQAHLYQVLNQRAGAKNNHWDEERYSRFSIDRSFVVKGIGTVVTGTLVSGTLRIGDKIFHSRSGIEVRIKGLRVDQSEIETAIAGQRVAVNISIDHHGVYRGDWLLDEFLLPSSRDVDAVLQLIDDGDYLKRNRNVHLYHNASHTMAEVRRLHFESADELNKNNVWVQIKTRDPVYALYGDRFVIRDSAGKKTIGGGHFVDTKPPLRRRHSQERHRYLQALDQDANTALLSVLDNSIKDISLRDFSRSRNLKEAVLLELVNPLLMPNESVAEELQRTGDQSKKSLPENTQAGILLEAGDMLHSSLIGAQSFFGFANTILAKIQSYQQEYPERQGLAPLELKRISQFSEDYAFFQRILHKLLSLNCLSRTGTLIHSPEHRAQDRAEDVSFFNRLKPLLLQDELTAPRTRELCEMLDMDLKILDKHLHRLCLAGKLAQVAANRYYLPESLLKHADIAKRLAAMAPDNMFTVIQYRDESGIGRNLCIQILEFFDRQGFTLRRSNKRLIQTSKNSLFSSNN